MRTGIFTWVCISIICLDVLTTCKFRNPKEPVKPITEAVNKPLEAETIGVVESAESVPVGKEALRWNVKYP